MMTCVLLRQPLTVTSQFGQQADIQRRRSVLHSPTACFSSPSPMSLKKTASLIFLLPVVPDPFVAVRCGGECQRREALVLSPGFKRRRYADNSLLTAASTIIMLRCRVGAAHVTLFRQMSSNVWLVAGELWLDLSATHTLRCSEEPG